MSGISVILSTLTSVFFSPQYSSEEEEESLASAFGKFQSKQQNKKLETTVDHSKIHYPSFRKNFYVEVLGFCRKVQCVFCVSRLDFLIGNPFKSLFFSHLDNVSHFRSQRFQSWRLYQQLRWKRCEQRWRTQRFAERTVPSLYSHGCKQAFR